MDWIFLFFLLIFFIVSIQPVLAQRRLSAARHAKIRELEKVTGARVITLIHRQERGGLFNRPSQRYIDIDDAQSVIHAIRTTPKNRDIALVLHTPGGLVLAASQIARAMASHPGKVTVYVPVFAMSGGTLLAMAADHIVMDPFAVLGPIDPQIAGIPAASIVNAKAQKPVTHVHDLTMVLADVSEKAITQLRVFATELLSRKFGPEHAAALADRMTGGEWTHDYAITPQEAASFGFSVSTDLPEEVAELMHYYPQPVRQFDSVESSPPEGEAALLAKRLWGDWAK